MKSPTLALILAATGVSVAQPASISINFVGNSGGKGNATLEPSEVAGVQPASHWNNIVSGDNDNASSTVKNLINSKGVPTSTDISFKKNFWSINNGDTPDGKLSSGYLNTTAEADTSITISQLNSEFTRNGYSVILYLGGTDAQTPHSAIEVGASINGGDTQWIKHFRSEDGTVNPFHSQTFDSEEKAEASESNSNYIVFKGLKQEQVKITIFKDPDSTIQWHRASIKGLQIVRDPDKPTGALIGIGGISLNLKQEQ